MSGLTFQWFMTNSTGHVICSTNNCFPVITITILTYKCYYYFAVCQCMCRYAIPDKYLNSNLNFYIATFSWVFCGLPKFDLDCND